MKKKLIIVFSIFFGVLVTLFVTNKIYKTKMQIWELQGQVAKLSGLQKEVSLLRLNQIIKNSMNIDSVDKFQLAISIRNKIYQQVPVKQSPEQFEFMNYDELYLTSLRDTEVGHICKGLAITYITALESQGIPARSVQFLSKNSEPYDSHATVEFWHKGKWYACDPTFNVMFKKQNEYLSYAELYKVISKGEAYEVVSNGFELVSERTLDNYYIKLNDLMKYMVIHPSTIYSHDKVYNYPIQFFPQDWNGVIILKGEQHNITYFTGIYEQLSQGILR